MSNTDKFIKYVSTPLESDEIISLYEKNEIYYERSILFYDFITSLMGIIFSTYLGDDVMLEEDKINHFKWCWGKNINNFKEENINFSNMDEAHQYFLQFMSEVFYSINKNNMYKIKSEIYNIWKFLFSPTNSKTKSEIDMFIEIYGLLNRFL